MILNNAIPLYDFQEAKEYLDEYEITKDTIISFVVFRIPDGIQPGDKWQDWKVLRWDAIQIDDDHTYYHVEVELEE